MTSHNLIILIFSGGYLPGCRGGGPIRSISNLVDALGDEFDFKIVAMDRDLGSSESYAGVKNNSWQRVRKAEVFYISPGNLSFPFLRRLINANIHDVLYLNSFFSPGFTIKPLLLRRLGLIKEEKAIIAPRGEFSRGALKIKPIKKKTFIYLAKLLDLYRNVLWQASSVQEKDDILAVFKKAQVFIASVPILDVSNSNKLDSPHPIKASDTKRPGKLKVVFLSRISTKKNLYGALKMMQSVSGEVLFNIYGPLEEKHYWEKCQRVVDELPANIRVQYKGAIGHDEVAEVFSDHDLFLFPTHGENFGHVIIEALVSGCPVLISDQTPWRDLDVAGVGWDLPLDNPKRFTNILQRCVDMGSDELRAFSQRAREYGLKKSINEISVQQNRDMFNFGFNRTSLFAVNAGKD
jgi:glycosyltransferase involved in cell wall biosynthesis